MAIIDFWKLLAGLGLFLYGMFHLEDAMKHVEGRSFKLFLQKYTKNKFSAIFSGTITTALLQSSSIVNLMVLSFVGAGMLSMRNALSVTLGSNLGGTFNSWLVALLGFNVNIERFTLPIIAVSGICLVLFRNKNTIYQVAKFFIGFGLLFLGLQFMKESMDELIKVFDFTPYLKYNRFVFVLIGFIITAVIQTSSATVVIVLSALYAKIIPIETAVAVVLGAELGTTIKLLFGSIGGIAAKKRVATANIFFNIISSVFGFILLVPIINFLRDVIGIHNPIFILVSFQTFINIVGVFICFFLLNFLGDFLEKRFDDNDNTATVFIQNTSPELYDTAIEMMENEIGLFINRAIQLNMEVFEIVDEAKENKIQQFSYKKNSFSNSLSYNEKYNYLKQAEGEIVTFYAKMIEEKISNKNLLYLNQLMESLRNAMYAAKSMKDIHLDKKEFSNSASELKYEIYTLFRAQLIHFYTEINQVLLLEDKVLVAEKLKKMIEEIKIDYQKTVNKSYENAGKEVMKDVDISTIFIVNRELYTSCKAIIFSLKDFLLDTTAADNFEDILISKSWITIVK